MVTVVPLHTMVVLASCYDKLVMPSKWPYHGGCVTFFFLPLRRFTTMVASKGLEKARAYLNQVPWD